MEGLMFQNVFRDFNEEALIMSIIFHVQCTHCFAGFLQTSSQKQTFTGHLRQTVKKNASYLNNLITSNLHEAFLTEGTLSLVTEILFALLSKPVELST